MLVGGKEAIFCLLCCLRYSRSTGETLPYEEANVKGQSIRVPRLNFSLFLMGERGAAAWLGGNGSLRLSKLGRDSWAYI
jgi:hypothetical protein